MSRRSRRAHAGILAVAALLLATGLPLKPDIRTKLSPDLIKAMAASPDPAGPFRIWVYLRDKGETGPGSLTMALAKTRQALAAHAAWRRSKVRPQAYLVDYEDLPVSSSYSGLVEALVLRVRTVSRWLNALSVEATADQVRTLAALDAVDGLDVVRAFRRSEADGDAAGPSSPAAPPSPAAPSAVRNPIYGPAYAQLAQINVPALHQQGLSGRGVVVCLLDVGFRWDHEVFRMSRLIGQRDFVFGDADVRRDAANPNDFSDAHGTATWSLLGGFKFGTMIGPAFGADILLGKTEVESSEKPIEEDYWAAGIEWAESLGAEVVSSSLGYTDWYAFKDMDGKTAVTTKAANRAVSLGVVVVNAAGNERRNAWGHIIAPADGFGVIAVGAVDAAGLIASFSSPGPTFDGRIKPEVCAFGVSNWVAAIANDGGDTYVTGSGTSYATPLVAGVVALLLEAHRDWTPAQVRDALMKTANKAATPNNDYGWGVIDAAAAASMAAKPVIDAAAAARIR